MLDGIQYDEALMVLGTVQMRNSREILPLPQDPHTWTCAFGRCFPLMTVRYVGAFKEYLTLPAMMLFGSGPAVIRLVGILWASLAVWGVGRFAGPGAAMLLAVSPAFSDQTAFDNGAVVGWSGALGLSLIALTRFREESSNSRAVWLGAAAGLGIWCRANFLWLVFGACVAAAPSMIRWLRRSPRQVALAIAGLLLGSLPFWIYQVISRGGTFEAVGMFRAEGAWSTLLADRAGMFARVLISDLEHRAIWAAPDLPAWQPKFVAAAFAVALFSALWKGGIARQAAISLAIFYAFLFSSRLPVAEHHFIPALPLAAAVIGLGASARGPWLAAAALYGALAMYWQFAAIRGIRATGGTGQWSDAITQVNAHLLRNPGGRTRVLDWGLQNNLFVLSDTRVSTVEDFGEQWEAKIEQGGSFLANGPENNFYTAPLVSFRRALEQSGKRVEPIQFRERRGRVFAELWVVPPGPGPVTLLDGFHEVEPGGWRWTKKRFTIRVSKPAAAGALTAQFHVPDVLLAKLGPIRVEARSGGKTRGSAVLSKPGEARLTIEVPASGETLVEFELDKALPPGKSDPRELGIVATSFRF